MFYVSCASKETIICYLFRVCKETAGNKYSLTVDKTMENWLGTIN